MPPSFTSEWTDLDSVAPGSCRRAAPYANVRSAYGIAPRAGSAAGALRRVRVRRAGKRILNAHGSIKAPP